MKTEEQHRRHIASTYRIISEFVEEMNEIASRGKPRSGTGQNVTPIRADIWEPIKESLKRVVAECESLTCEIAPEEFEEIKETEPISRTYVWLSVLLGRIEEELESLQPQAVESKYGRMSNKAREVLRQRVSEALTAAGEARKELDRTKQADFAEENRQKS